MEPIRNQYDVVVAGGGPAGAAVAALVAEKGYGVLLLERSAEPTFKIGESLMPATYWSFERLGVLDKMRQSAFPTKWSVQFYNAAGSASSPFYFHEFRDEECSQTWQVRRADFDQMLLDNAIEKGADVRRGVAVREFTFDGERATGARLRLADGSHQEVASRVVVDASGQSALLARQLGILEVEPNLRNIAYYTHYEGAIQETGKDAGATVIYRTSNRKSWFWFIPQPDGIVSIGVVGSVDDLVDGRKRDPEVVFDEELALCPRLTERLVEARQTMPIRAIRDFSYNAERVAGDGWVLTGDAFGFIDPIYSSGVFLALKSGEMAADSIVDALAADAPTGENLGRFEDEYKRGSEALRQLVYAYYDDEFSVAAFLKRHPQYREQLIEMLVGNVFRIELDDFMAALTKARTASKQPAGMTG